MKSLFRKLLYICIGIFVLADVAYRLKLPGSEGERKPVQKFERRPAVAPSSGLRKRQIRGSGPKFWVKHTKDWGPGDAVSKRHEFPGYNDPVEPVGMIGGRKSDPKRTVGSAFAIAPNGLWLTARHVVEGCLDVIVQAGLHKGKPVNLSNNKVTLHPTADVAIIASARTDYDRQSFPLVDQGNLAGEAFHIGFPRGKPGAAHSSLLGQKYVRHQGRRESGEQIAVWAEISRLPNVSGGLGGISGGVVVDRTGAVIGTNSAGNVRRGRIMTSQPKTLWQTVRQSGRDAEHAKGQRPAIAELTAQNYPSYAKAAIQDRRVVRVICVRKR